MQLLASIILLLVSFALAQGPPATPFTISNPATGLFFDLRNPGSEFEDLIVGRVGNGKPSQVWQFEGDRLVCIRPSITPLGVTASGMQEGELLVAFFKAWANVNITAAGGGLFTLTIGKLLVTAGAPDGPLTLESPASGAELQKWLFTTATAASPESQ